ncbi:hypothetical protein [Bradyrhizobium sp. USDA 4529]
MATFERWVRHLVSPEDLRKRAKKLQTSRGAMAERQRMKGSPKRRTRPMRHRYSVRTCCGPIALRAF